MNRRLPLVVTLVVALTSCSSTYRVKREDLARVPEIIPAVAEDGRETWISSEAVRNPRETEVPAYVDVDVSDNGKNLAATGGAIAAYGLFFAVTGVVFQTMPDTEDDPKGYAGVGLMSIGGVLALMGGTLALAGFLTSPPEQPAPTAEALPPARR